MSSLLKPDSIRRTFEAIWPHLRRTPTVDSEHLARKFQCQLFFKLENLQRTGSFKCRGALSKLLHLNPEEISRGLVTGSAGNHGLGVSYAASIHKTRAVIVVPRPTPQYKKDSIRAYGGELVEWGESWDEANEHALELSRQEGLSYIHAFGDEAVAAGQATVALEMLDAIPDLDVLVVSIGGGGLIGGIGAYAKQVRPEIKIYGVEPVGAASMHASIEAGQVVALKSATTIADSLAAKRVSELTLRLVQQYVDGLVQVPDDLTMKAIVELLQHEKHFMEPAASCNIAALELGLIPGIHRKKVGVVFCGSNFPLEKVPFPRER